MANQSKSGDGPARVVLDGVQRIGYEEIEGRVELCPFASSLRACLAFMGEEYTYEYIMGTSGAAFRLLWNPSMWDGANVDVIVMASDPLEPYHRAFEAVGRSCDISGNKDVRHEACEQVRFFDKYEDYDYFRNRIVESIGAKGRPVLALGVIGPPECCIITGYDEYGQVLIGWNYFQGMPEFNAGLEFEPSGCFRKRHWFKNTPGLIIIGEKQEKPPLGEIHRKALRWAIEVVRTPMVHERHNGLAAYTVWAEALLRDEEFPADDMGTVMERMMCHGDAQTMVAEGRWYASLFLSQIARHEPAMAQELLLAAACFAAEHDLIWQTWHLVGGIGFSADKIDKLARPGVRRQIAALILQARDRDAEAADHIERALAR